ncbi:MAG: hypothetical protein Fur0027_16650 [Raineya sp.]
MQSVEEHSLKDFGNTCASLLLSSDGKILYFNKLAAKLFYLEKKNIGRTNFFKRFLDKKSLRDKDMSKAWVGDVSYKNIAKRMFSQWLPQATGNHQLNIFPTLSQESSERLPKLEKVFKNTSDGVLLLDVQEGSIVEANDTACKLLDYQKSDLIGKNFSVVEIALHAQKEETAWTKFLIELKQKSPEPLQILTQFIQKDASTIPVKASIYYEENDGDSYIGVIFKDIY